MAFKIFAILRLVLVFLFKRSGTVQVFTPTLSLIPLKNFNIVFFVHFQLRIKNMSTRKSCKVRWKEGTLFY